VKQFTFMIKLNVITDKKYLLNLRISLMAIANALAFHTVFESSQRYSASADICQTRS